jgi:murein tripeptide amidase MpaA
MTECATDYLHYRKETISQSVGGLSLFQITLTKRKALSTNHNKKVIYITARQHAAETHGSFIMKQILVELTHCPEKYDNLLSNYIVKLIPMVNPDGVTVGNARVSLVG